MNEKDIQNLTELAESKIRAGVTPQEALATFVGAGILNENGEFTAPYQQLLDDANLQG